MLKILSSAPSAMSSVGSAAAGAVKQSMKIFHYWSCTSSAHHYASLSMAMSAQCCQCKATCGELDMEMQSLC
jgi:hypothetical protein